MLSTVGNPAPLIPAPGFADPGRPPPPRVLVHRPLGLNGAVELWSGHKVERPWAFFPSSFAFFHIPSPARPSFWSHRRARFDATPTSIAVLTPGDLIRTAASDRIDFDLVVVDPAFIDKILPATPGFGSRRHFRPALVEDKPATEAMLDLVGALQSPVSEAARTNALLTTFIHRIFQRARDTPAVVPGSAIDRVIERARSFVNTHYAEKIGLDEVAKAAGMSKFHLARTFHSRLGLPIHQYLNRVRLGRALELLRAGRRPIHVAQVVGFADQPHLTRVFRDELGFTPAQYLRGHGARDTRARAYSVSSSLSDGGLESSESLDDSFCGRGMP